MYSIKFSYGGEVRRAQVAVESGYEAVALIAQNLFVLDKPIKLQWTDDEGDSICCSSDLELAEAIRVMSSEGKKAFKFDIVVLAEGSCRAPAVASTSSLPVTASTPPPSVTVVEPQVQPQVQQQQPMLLSQEPISATPMIVHNGVKCDNCGMSPIVGVRYKCTARHNYDLCADCEALDTTGLPMIKIYQSQETTGPSTAPSPEATHTMSGRGGGRGHGRVGGRGHIQVHGHGHPVHGGRGGFPTVVPATIVTQQPIGPCPNRFGHGAPRGYPPCPNVPPGFSPYGPGPVHPLAPPFVNPHEEWVRGMKLGEDQQQLKPWQIKWNQYSQQQQQQQNPSSVDTHEVNKNDTTTLVATQIEPAIATPLLPPSPVSSCSLSKQFESFAKAFSGRVLGSLSPKQNDEDEVNQQLLEEALKQSLVDFQKAKAEELQQYQLLQQQHQEMCGDSSYFGDCSEGADASQQHEFAVANRPSLDVSTWLPSMCEVLCPLKAAKAAAKAAGLIGCMQVAQKQCQEHLNQQHEHLMQQQQTLLQHKHFVDSLQESCSQLNVAAPVFVPSMVSAGQPAQKAATANSPSAAPAATSASAPNPKLMARFVRDVTFPDGTHVRPKSSLLKTWRIRNDGQTPWPANVNLVCSGGDFLTPRDLVVPVGVVGPNEETEVTVTIDVPEATGRHVAYFRLRVGTDGPHFGQRMWIDIRVTEDESEWQVVSGILSTSASPSVSLASSTNSVQLDQSIVAVDTNA